MTPLMVSSPVAGVHLSCATVWPPTTFWQSYADAGVRSISPPLTLSVESLSKPPGNEPVVQADCGPRSACEYQYARSTVGLEMAGGLVPIVDAYTCEGGPHV